MSNPINPNFQWNEFSWQADVKLPAWSGFQERNRPYGAISSDEPSNGTIKIVFAPEGRGDESLNSTEMELINWFISHQRQVIESITNTLFSNYAAIKGSCIEESGEEMAEYFPEVKDVSDIKSVVGIISVNIHQVSKDNIPYIGVEMGCNWEEEHGMGFLLHGNKIVEAGGADTAFLLWLAEKHANET
ncbi:DUF6985 domain-containing protein [Agarivorans gilvus]|uniref:DUF6985 domain-containing protein n=1 Tax=Agarivorans gilvus TaxID=680279 RepID=A0ABQ1I7L3_9ALTE|nr:hypothetical protein [Agarivorans gilvus]GGB21113.1 hypothetical protein GCM10007414_38120 [Agarivorans gilvus]